MGTIVDDKRPRKLDNRVDNPASAADSDTVGETEELPCCLPARGAGALPLPAFDDEDGPRLGDDLPPVFDAHVHIFADALFAAIWRWFDTNGWPIRHKLTARDVVAFLRTRGVDGALLLHYAHKPGIARAMNGFVKDIVDESGGFAIGTATVCPGEPDQVAIVDDAFTAGLRGIKLHCHVQGVAVDDARLFPIYELCQSRNQVVVVHAGREPWSNALPVDPHAVCAVQRTARVIANFPRLRMVVPHLGADEFDEYAALMKSCDTLWLDTDLPRDELARRCDALGFDTGDECAAPRNAG